MGSRRRPGESGVARGYPPWLERRRREPHLKRRSVVCLLAWTPGHGTRRGSRPTVAHSRCGNRSRWQGRDDGSGILEHGSTPDTELRRLGDDQLGVTPRRPARVVAHRSNPRMGWLGSSGGDVRWIRAYTGVPPGSGRRGREAGSAVRPSRFRWSRRELSYLGCPTQVSVASVGMNHLRLDAGDAVAVRNLLRMTSCRTPRESMVMTGCPEIAT